MNQPTCQGCGKQKDTEYCQHCGDNRYTTHKHNISLLTVLWGAIITMLLIGLIVAHA